MLTKEQAQAAADALLEDKRAEQAALHAKLQERRLASRKWMGASTLLGLAAGGLIGHYSVGQMFPWTLRGMGFGIAIGFALSRRAA